MEHVTLKVPTATSLLLAALAHRRGTTVSELMQHLVDREIVAELSESVPPPDAATSAMSGAALA